ncbi:MAG: T9SS type A sorting domain-containing protein [Flavobacteriales bacterium]|nr:T9SS type A sorting domain-containing protein [Flavobacteriales bacterium]
MIDRTALLVRSLVLAGLIGVVALFVSWTGSRVPDAHAFHTDEELASFRGAGGALYAGSNTFFKGSGACSGCHGHDASGFAMTTPGGVDVNVADDWRSSMMANSARDPFWRAKVSHEVQVNPGHQAALEDKCTSCHAPMGRHEKHLLGLGAYSIAEMEQDPLALDGVSCVPCHIQSADSIGLFNSGNMKFDTLGRPLYGPYGGPDDPLPLFGAPMTAFVGYQPLFGEHINDGGLCASCHTLITETADLNGAPTGGTFVEQATYHEWLNSDFNNKEHVDGVTCQGCHVPRIDDGVVISANYLFLQPRSPFGLHHFAGANVFMLEMLKDHITDLGLTADAVQFDSTIMRTKRMLKQNSLLLEPSVASRTADTAFIDVKLTNLAGHKFPSGYPARRAWVELVVVDDAGDTLFRSGGWDATNDVIGHDPSWEPHYDVIRDPAEAQIYEMVMADVNGDRTTVLERAASKLKDNRLAPAGFTTGHYTYDTTTVENVPASDIDFNRDGLGVEGSGTDIVHYHVPMGGYTGTITVRARVWYQSAPPRYMTEMFGYSSAAIDTFKTYYLDADNSPVQVKEASVVDVSTAIDDIAELGVRVYPNPVPDGRLEVLGLSERVLEVEVYDPRGVLVARTGVNGRKQWAVELPRTAGTYLVAFRTKDRTFVERVVSLAR